ncbi:hypothetical protein ACFYNO_12010 [Kitasatospora sp. NPDC006697]|uniref:hypothetical protein n=1 Tax=Kitasatospora sp. NPDC006697 TaxID=3364020 RepID=UPI0036A13177
MTSIQLRPPVPVLIVDPAGSPGERVAARLWEYCYEGDEAFYLARTDGWAERRVSGDSLWIGLAVYPAVLRALEVDPADFRHRSALDENAVLLLEAQTPVDSGLTDRLEPVTLLLSSAGAQAEEDWPVVLAPPR